MVMFRKSLYATLTVGVLLCGCSTLVTIKPTVDLPPSIPKVQMTVGVYLSPAFRSYEPSARLYSFTTYKFPLGPASVSLFQELFPKAFEKVVWLESPPPITTGVSQLSAVIEPQVDAFQVFSQRVGNSYNAWAEIHYKFTVYNPGGEVITSWMVEGVGESSAADSLGKAVNYAMQEAGWRFITSFNDVPEAKRWLQGVSQQDAIAAESAQTTHPAPEFAKGAVLGTYPGVVTASADSNPKPYGQSVEVSTRLKELGLVAVRIEVKNQGSHRLLLRRRDIGLVCPDGTEISSLPAYTFSSLGVTPGIMLAPHGNVYSGAQLFNLFGAIVNTLSIISDRNELEANLSIYRDKELYDATLTKGRSVQGYVYFFVPVGGASLDDLKLAVPVIDYDAATWYIVRLPLSMP